MRQRTEDEKIQTEGDRGRKGGEKRKEETKTGGHGDRLEGTSLLLHACCAPCLTYTSKEFRKDFDKVTALWFNPNIHPFQEYKRRFKALRKYEKEVGLDVIYLDRYGLDEFLEKALNVDSRCEYCLEWRLRKTAAEAVKRGYDAFSTTLVLSPYQDHDRLQKIGSRAGREEEIDFIYHDMRDGFEEHHRLADEMGLYKQGYCGCIFSEKERYHKKLID